MKFSALTVLTVCSFASNNHVSAFIPVTTSWNSQKTAIPSSTAVSMAIDAPADIPVIQSRGGAPVDVRYSDFLKLVDYDRIEKVTFSADGTKLLGVDADGNRLKIESLPNDPELLTQLTNHKVIRKRYLDFSFQLNNQHTNYSNFLDCLTG